MTLLTGGLRALESAAALTDAEDPAARTAAAAPALFHCRSLIPAADGKGGLAELL